MTENSVESKLELALSEAIDLRYQLADAQVHLAILKAQLASTDERLERHDADVVASMATTHLVRGSGGKNAIICDPPPLQLPSRWDLLIL